MTEVQKDQKRLFTDAEKTFLFNQQEGKCSSCQGILTNAAEAHHVIQHSEGGETSLSNAALLCKTCHALVHRPLGEQSLTTITGLAARDWQKRMVKRVRPYRDSVVVACPAAGKTIGAGFWLRDNLRGKNPFILIVSPSKNVRSGWREDITRHFGIQITDNWDRRGMSPDYHGASICYASIKPALVQSARLHAQANGMLLVLDEVHHGAVENMWGKYLEDLIDIADRSLMLTGTPFRTDGDRIPGLTYNGEGQVKPHFTYSYRKAISDGVCRSVKFRLCDSTASYSFNGDVQTVRASECDDVDSTRVSNTLYAAESEHLHELVSKTITELDEVRKRKPDAAALFVCRPSGNAMDTSDAEDSRVEQVANKIKQLTGETAVIVTSKDDKAQQKLADFKTSGAKYLVAIMMVAEGVNIPRLQVACLMRHVKSELLFRQLFGPGRVGRQTPASETEEAIVVLSHFPVHENFASIIESESNAGLKEKKERESSEETVKGDNPDYDFTPISATFEESMTFAREKAYAGADVLQIEAIQAEIENDTGRQIPLDVAAKVRAMLGVVPEKAQEPQIDYATMEVSLRKRFAKLVRRYCAATKKEHKEVYIALHNEIGFKSLDAAISAQGVQAIERYIELIESWFKGSAAA